MFDFKEPTIQNNHCTYFCIANRVVLSHQELIRNSKAAARGTAQAFTDHQKCTGEGGTAMKGFSVSDGYMGYVDGRYMLFASEDDYREYVEE